jgi:uncharacterized protein YrzB (UPF0473 family)
MYIIYIFLYDHLQDKTGVVTVLDSIGKPRTAKLVLTTDTLSVLKEEIVSVDSNGNDQMLNQVQIPIISNVL